MSEPTGIHKAILGVMTKMKAVGKDSNNAQQNFKYRGIDAVYNEMHKLMAAEGIYNVGKVLDKVRGELTTKNGAKMNWTSLTVEYTFYAADGSSVSTQAAGKGSDALDKDESKAMAMCHKYALFQMFMIPTDDGDAGEQTTTQEPAQRRAAPAAAQAAASPAKAAPAAAQAGKPAAAAAEKKSWGNKEADKAVSEKYLSNINGALEKTTNQADVKSIVENFKKKEKYLVPSDFQKAWEAAQKRYKELPAATTQGGK